MASIIDQDKDKLNQQPTGAGGVNTQAPAQPTAAAGKNTSGTQNFQQYAAANKQSGQRIGNLIGSNVQQQAQSTQASTEAGDVSKAFTADKDRIKNDLAKFQGIAAPPPSQHNIQPNKQPISIDKSTPVQPVADLATLVRNQKYQQLEATAQQPADLPADATNQILNPRPAVTKPAAPTGYASLFQDPTLGAEQQVNASLADWANKLASGQTQAGQLGQQSSQAYNTAGQKLAGLQDTQQNLNTEAGRFSLLQNLLGKSGTYSNPASRLDQALFQTNTNQLGNIQKSAQQLALEKQNALQSAQQLTDTQLADLKAAGLEAQTTTKDIAQKSLTGLDTELTARLDATKGLQKSQQEDILKQLQSGEMTEDTAKTLGIGEGTTLFNLLKDDNSKQYINNANIEALRKSNVVDSDALTRYAALQKMMQNDPSQFAYTKLGKVDPAYTLASEKFRNDLGARYNERANQAEQDYISGQGASEYSHGFANMQHDTERAALGANIKDMISTQQLRDASKTLAAMNAPTQTATATDSARYSSADQDRVLQGMQNAAAGAISGASTGAKASAVIPALAPLGTSAGAIVGAIPGLVQAGAGIVNNFADAIYGGDKKGHARREAYKQAQANLQGSWDRYLANQGYNDSVRIRKALENKG